MFCSACDEREESGDEILTCETFGKYGEDEIIPVYNWFYENKISDIITFAQYIMSLILFS